MTPDVFMCLNCGKAMDMVIYCRNCWGSMVDYDDITDERDAASERLHLRVEKDGRLGL